MIAASKFLAVGPTACRRGTDHGPAGRFGVEHADYSVHRSTAWSLVHVGQPVRGFGGNSGSDAVGVHGQELVEQGRHMVLAHRVHVEERKQLVRALVVGKDRAEVLPEAPHAVEVGRLAARDVMQLPNDSQQGYVIEVHDIFCLFTVAVYASWGICSITQKKKSVFGCSIPNRFSLEATWPRW